MRALKNLLGGFTAIDELVVDHMRKLGLAHFIGMLTIECPNEPGPSSRFKQPTTPVTSDGDDLPQNENERPTEAGVATKLQECSMQGNALDKAR